ncbi:hypothetical protein [Aequorivita marina]|uniref:hypothetical protein n=1 Tax=Aequorivita marina TaxID=3073654 RepID=UPI00287692F9|nr:hypothetical protein [Aequorivita sp. S2608]MDS1297132.1 hypothetical protein [Aequorivita sp. S2608]
MKSKILLLILTLVFISCNKDDYVLTGINNDGTGGISCRINGTILRPSGGGMYGNKTAKFDYYDGHKVLIVGFTSRDGGNNKFSSVTLFAYDVDIDNLEGQTINLVAKSYNESYATYTSGKATSGSQPGEDYATSSAQVGEVKVLFLDKDERIITGEFWFNAENEFGEIVKVNDGRFDLNYN